MYNYATIYKHHDLFKNFSFEKKIDNDSAQGSCGILKIKNLNIPIECTEEELYGRDVIIINNKTKKVFFKFGNNGYNCTLERQEYIIAVDLFNTCNHVPNFMRPYQYIKNCFIYPNSKDPFCREKNESHEKRCVDIATFEYLKHKSTIYDIFNDKDIHDKIKKNLIIQVGLAIICAQQNCRFVHNDLHGKNIIIIECPKEVKLLYKVEMMGEIKYYLIETFGFIPVIIDYGFSYSKDCDGLSLECADADKHGYITYKYDSISDFIRFFVCCYHIKRGCEDVKNYIYNLFKDLPVDLKTSRELIVNKSSMDYIESKFIENFHKVFGKNKRSSNYIYQLARLYIRAITLPISKIEIGYLINIDKELQDFFIEWHEIEKWCAHDYERVYLQREFFDLIRSTDSREDVIKYTKKILFFITNRDVELVVNWDKLYKSVTRGLVFFENLIYKNITTLDKKRNKYLYSKLISGEQMLYNFIKTFYNPKENILKGDFVLLIDNTKYYNEILSLEEDIGMVSGKKLYNLLFRNNDSDTKSSK